VCKEFKPSEGHRDLGAMLPQLGLYDSSRPAGCASGIPSYSPADGQRERADPEAFGRLLRPETVMIAAPLRRGSLQQVDYERDLY